MNVNCNKWWVVQVWKWLPLFRSRKRESVFCDWLHLTYIVRVLLHLFLVLWHPSLQQPSIYFPTNIYSSYCKLPQSLWIHYLFFSNVRKVFKFHPWLSFLTVNLWLMLIFLRLRQVMAANSLYLMWHSLRGKPSDPHHRMMARVVLSLFSARLTSHHQSLFLSHGP